MRFQCVVVLALIFLVRVEVESTPTMTAPRLMATRSAHSENDLLDLTKRRLRTENTDGEERLNLKPASVLDKVKGIFKSKITPNTLMRWDKKNKSPEYAFKKFNLHKTGNKLFDDPYFLLWAAYTRVVQSKPEDEMFAILKAKYGDDVLASMLIQAKQAKKTENIATSLQRAQLNSSHSAQLDTREVYKLLGVAKTAPNSANRLLFKQFMHEQNALRKASNA